jgi:hypothetical protein
LLGRYFYPDTPLSEEQLGCAAEARWGGRWRERLGAAHERHG